MSFYGVQIWQDWPTGHVQDFVLISLARIAVLRTYMRPIFTDGVAWSVGLSVTISQNWANPSPHSKRNLERFSVSDLPRQGKF